MRPKLLILSLAAAGLGVTACGGGSSSSASHASSSPSATHLSGATRRRPILIYRVKLTGQAETPPGAAHGAGDAIVAFHGSSVVCWRFAHLHGFTGATFAHIHSGAAGRSGSVVIPLSTAPGLHHQGCVAVSAGLSKSIRRSPQAYYVNIHSARYPGGAVRAQL